jgi:uncharacterized protein (TIGR02145 family)
MKKLNHLLFIMLIIMSYGCTEDSSDEVTDLITVKLIPSMEINQDEYIPLKSATEDTTTTLYAVQVLENGAPYCYGLFNDLSKMDIVLTTTKSYKILVAAYQNGTGTGLKSETKDGLTTYYLPDSVSLTNSFVKGNKLIGINKISNTRLKSKSSVYREIDAFYQEVNFVATKGISTVPMTLKRTGFGLGLTIKGYAKGTLQVFIGDDTLTFGATNKSYFTIRSFSESNNSLMDIASVDTFFEEAAIKAKWINTSGSVIEASGTIKLKRNYQAPVSISINSTGTVISLDSWYNDAITNEVTDIDGNVYHTVVIGTQTWMVENLKTTKYRNGDAIPNISDFSWPTTTFGGYCSYLNSTYNKSTFGYMYNWYAAMDSRNLAPAGWHIPSDAEWKTLSDYLGGDTVAGGKLKDTIQWYYPNIGATNQSGFSGLPGGITHTQEWNLYAYGYWWSTSEYSATAILFRQLYFNESTFVRRIDGVKTWAMSVRCIKD